MALDTRVHAVRRDIADIALADRIFAPHYARPDICACALPAAMLRSAPAANARAVSQLLRGECFAVVDVAPGWVWGYALHDNYVGYLPEDVLGHAERTDHVVSAASAPVFAAPDIKAPVRTGWTLGAAFAGTAQGDFVAAAEGYVHRRHAHPAAEKEVDPVAVAERLLGAPYLWGGRGAGGIDCSGLIQLALGMAGVAAPRDSDQQRALGTELAADAPLRRGDLIFFPGHVGLMADAANLLHANAHWMATVIEPLADVVARLAPKHAEPVVARRRLA